jgi:serine/threonine protein kinase
MAYITGHQLGNYRLIRHLGRGAFADVYLGEHLYLKSEAALKVPRISPKEEEMERFLKEAQTLVGLRHPNIVRVLEFGVEGDIPFLVIDYAPDGTVRTQYPKGSRLSLTTTVAWIKQVAAALQYAHNRGIIHRDVKPENILLDFDQHILLSDFGLALFAPSAELLSTQEGVGTAPYMSPEQLYGKPMFASDQYALGIVAYEWLCGQRPFEGNYWVLVNQHMHDAPAPLRQFFPALPAAVENVVLRALAKDPQQRFVSVQAFAYALERASRENSVDLDIDSQVTAPLMAISPSSVNTPTTRTQSHYARQAKHRVFLTSAPADGAFSMRLQADLHARNILVSNDHLAYVPDANRQDTLRQVIRDAQIALVVISPHARSSRTLREQLHIIGMYQQHLVFVWAAGDDISTVLPETWGRSAKIDLVDARETRYKAALDEIIDLLETEIPAGITEEPTLPEPPGEPRNPYKGLRAFTRDDAADFFGRDALIVQLAETIESFLMAEKPAALASRLLAVIGPSGSGKSSVVMAGLLPGLQKSALPGSEDWVYLDPITPGKRPLESLVLAFAPHLPERSLRAIHHDLEDDSARGLHWLATQLVKRPWSKVVLMIDQFEELFTQTLSQQERQQFIDLLVAAATEPRGPLIVILTLRADYYDRPMQYLQLSQLIEAHHTSVLPMNPHELRAVIEQPAVLPDVQLLFEDNLVGDLLFEAQGQAGALPLLEFTLDQLFHLRDGHSLTRKAYQRIGGVKGALAKHAESRYASLPSEEHRRLARALFLRLIDPGATEQDTTRRRASLEELSLPDSEQTKIMHEVAGTFVAARLLMTDDIAGTTTIEVSHEALVREWTRLADWLREAREDIRVQQTISEDAIEWEQHDKPRDRLYRGSQLREARTWAKRNIPSSNEIVFLRASTALRMRFRVVMTAIILLILLLSIPAGVLVRSLILVNVVTTNSDTGQGSLREVINLASPESTITFASNVKGTILLSSSDLVIAKNLTIQGPGAGILTISGGNSGHIVNVFDGNTVTMSGLSFKESNVGQLEGFIENNGTLTLINTVVSGNTSSGPGGGIFNNNRSKLTIMNSIVSSNTAKNGGGIFNTDGTLTVINSTISGNKAVAKGASGGGILDLGPLTLINSTVSGNTSTGTGGGIAVFGSRATITFCTIDDNQAQVGGGISMQDYRGQHSQVELGNSIIAGNHDLSGTEADIAGTLTSDGYNLIQDVSHAPLLHRDSAAADLIGLSPKIGPLQYNGGPTETQALLPGSPAIDKIPRKACHLDTIPTDQRGVIRPQGSACDIGAYEEVPPH